MTRPRNFQDILSRLPGAKQSGAHWTVPCPLPGHTTPAKHLTLKDAGDKALVTCQGGKHTYRDYCEAWGYESLTYSRDGNGTESRIVATYDYTDADGKLLYQVVRFEPKKFKQRQPDRSRGWLWNLEGISPVLYHLGEVLRAVREGQTVYIPEGEKDVDTLRGKGLTATTNSGGAEKWRPAYSEVLTGASVVILPDKDAAGQRHAVKVATSLHGKAKQVKIVELPDRDGHQVKDASDWLAAGGIVAELERLVSEAPEWKPKESGICLVCIADVDPETVSWLWYSYIPKGKLTLLEGDPGIGKSWICLAIATAVSLGKGLPETEAIEPASVVLATAEDGLGDTIRPRLDAMGADVSKIHAIKGALDFGDGGLAILERYIEQERPELVIIDPLVAYIGAGVDIHRANETRAVMAKLADIAEKHGCAILAIRHLTKGGTLKPIYRGLGSIDFAAACRSILLAGCDPDNPQKRGIVQIKSNLAPTGKAIGYELRDDSFYWTEECGLTAGRILAIENTEVTSVLDEAIDFLNDELVDGPVPASQVFNDAHDAGLSKITVKRAKAKLGIVTRRQGETGKRGGGRFTWELPVSHLEGQDDLEYQGYHIKENDTLNNSSLNNTPQGIGDDTLNPNPQREAILGMSVEKALELWRSEGAPIIHLGPGENCSDLEEFLSRLGVKPEHLQVVRAWLEEVIRSKRGGSAHE